MKFRNTIYLWAGLLAAFSGNALGFSVTPTAASGYEGDTIQLTINITEVDWIFDSNSTYCGPYESQFVIDLQQLSGNATWSDNTISGDFHLASGGAPFPQQNQIVFCDAEYPPMATYQGYSLSLHEDSVEFEGDETAQIRFTGQCNSGNNNPAPCTSDVSLTIFDTTEVVYTATIEATTAIAAEPDINGLFTIRLDKPAGPNGLYIYYQLSANSTATSGEDFEDLGSSLFIPEGRSRVTLPVVVIDDDLVEGDETVIVDLVADGFELGTPSRARVTIRDDDDIPTVSVAATDGAEPSTNGKFTFSLSKPAPQGGITVNFAVSSASTATESEDYEALPTSVTVAAGKSSVDVLVVVIDDDIAEGPETVIAELRSGATYEIGSPRAATMMIEDDDSAGLQVSATTLITREDGTADQFRVSLTSQPTADVIVNITSSNPSEGIVEPASILFNSDNWPNTQVVTVTGVDDNVVDGDIDYTVTLTTSSVDSNFASLAPVEIMATNYDNDGAPPIAFSQDIFSVKEEAGAAAITLARAGGPASNGLSSETVSSAVNKPVLADVGVSGGKMLMERPAAFGGELTVTFSTDDNNSGTTAIPGKDYTPVNEVLVWPAGDYAPKTVTIEILSGAALAGEVTVVLQLEVTGFNTLDYADLTISNDFLEDVIASINPDDLPPNLQSITRVILAACPQGTGQGGFQELCTDLLVEALEGGSVYNPLQQVTPDEASAARTPATQTQTVQNINVTGRQSALRGGATGLSMQGFSVNMAGFNMTTGMFRNFGTGYDSIQANATNPFATNYLNNSLVSNKANATDDDMDDFGNWGIWVSGKAIIGDKDATDREQGFDFDTAGLTVGVDYRFTDKLVAGAAFGYANNSIKLDGKSGKLDTTGLTGTIYGSYYPTANFYLDASLSLGKNDYKQNRNIVYQLNQIGAFVDEELRADYDGDQTGITFGTGYDFSKNGWVFGPTLFVEYVDISVDAYDEKLISSSTPGFTLGWATHINKQKYKSLIPQLGVQLSKAFSQSWGVIVPTAHVSWARELESDNSIVSGYFLGDTGQVNFNLLTDALDEDFFKAGVGLSAMFQNNKSAFVSVDGDFGRDLLSVYYINAGFRWEF